MNKNTIIGLVLIFAILIGSSYFFKPSKEDLPKKDSINNVPAKDSLRQLTNDSLHPGGVSEVADSDAIKVNKIASADKTDSSAVDSLEKNLSRNTDEFGSFSMAAKGSNDFYFLENDLFIIKISSKGGRVASVMMKKFLTWDQRPLLLFEEETSNFGYTFTSANRVIYTGDLFFQPLVDSKKISAFDTLRVSGNDSLSLVMRLYPNANDSVLDNSRYIEYVYNVHGNKYLLGFVTKFSNMSSVIPANVSYINLDWSASLDRQEQSLDNEKHVTTVYYKYYDGSVDYLNETKDRSEKLLTPVHWISFKQQFFSSTIIAKNSFISNAQISAIAEKDKHPDYLRSMSASMDIVYNSREDEQIFAYEMYFGPNKYKTLRKIGLDMERQIPLGWSFRPLSWINQFAVIPVFDYLEGFNLNYGIIILILTLLLKLVLFPIAYKTYMSSAKMRVLKPEIDEIGQKFPKKEDAMKKQQAVMALYKKAGVNPMSGCVPMLLQLPILIALFRFFPASIELRQQSFLWAHDLSSYDSVLSLPFYIPFYGDHVSLFCLLMTISTIIYTKLNNDMMSGSQQMPGMKTMMYIMPVMFLGFFNSFASGLSYYYLLANLITFAQMYAFRKFVNEDKIHLKIQENKARPVKKSGFQKRLEDMAKQKGYNPKR